MIQPLDQRHLEQAVTLVARVIAGMRQQGIEQWDEVYPSPSQLTTDIASRQAFGAFDEVRLVGYVVLNEDQSAEYSQVPWAGGGPVLVIHRLCVDPQASGQGVGRSLLAFAEGRAASQGYLSIRLDAFTQNPRALALYERHGYEFRGLVRFRKGEFRCYEKPVVPVEALLADQE